MRISRGAGLMCVGVVIVAAGALAGCGGGGSSPAPAAPTAPPIAAPAASLAQQSVAVSQPTSIPLPTSGSYGGTVSIPTPASAPSGGVTITEQLSSSAIDQSLPSLSLGRRSESVRDALSLNTALLFFALESSATVTFANAPGITLCVPAAFTSVANVSFYVAYYDLLRPSLAWQLGFEGPASTNGTACAPSATLSFSVPAAPLPFTLSAELPAFFALYAVSNGVPAPTPAPVASTTPRPAPTPFSLSSSSLALLASGATATVTISDPTSYTGGYSVVSTPSTVATAQVTGQTITITAVAAGSATVTVSDTNQRTSSIAVTVTTTNLPLQ